MTAMRGPLADLPIVLEAVSIARGGTVLLDKVSLTLAAGSPTAVVGPNGAGKTTLLRVAVGLDAATSGRVTWDGREHAPATRRAIMFQRPVMFRRSVSGNLRYALAAAGISRAQRNKRVGELLALAGLEGLSDRPARKLSGGEQQRLALARAWALHPEVLFLDEPTANLDPAAVREIETIIKAFDAAGTKIVMATHNLGQARRVGDEVIYLQAGRVMERATIESFFARPATAEAAAFVKGELPWV